MLGRGIIHSSSESANRNPSVLPFCLTSTDLGVIAIVGIEYFHVQLAARDAEFATWNTCQRTAWIVA